MKVKALVAIGGLAVVGCVGASAAPVVYNGTLSPSSPASGSVGGFSYFLDDGPNVDFWRLSLNAGQHYTIVGTRLNNNLDPAFDLLLGVTTADVSQFVDGTSWGGMTLIASADEEIANPGPGGDPSLSFVAPVTGLYTLAIGGSLSTDSGQYPYRLAVPEPGTMALALVGFAAAGWGRRKQDAAK